MGLPLWQPRVESDIPSRPEAKNPAANGRSRVRSTSTRDRGATAIRERPAARHGELRARERRRGLLQDLQERLIESNSSNGPLPIPEPPAREPVRRPVQPDNDVVVRNMRHFMDQYDLRDYPNTGSDEPVRHFGDAPDIRTLGRSRELAALERRREELIARSNQQLLTFEEFRRRHPDESQPASYSERRAALEERTSALEERIRSTTAMRERIRANRAERAALLDGLGDRNRSLSPENDAVWETLLTTVTPDPQPPSAGSSFTSRASAISRFNRSSGTSMTGLDTGPEDSTMEEQCDSDDDAGELGNNSARHSAVPASYADILRSPRIIRRGVDPIPDDASLRDTSSRSPRTRDDSDSGNAVHDTNLYDAYRSASDRSGGRPDATDDLFLRLVGGLGGMQHIVRNLVRREDIPNDWWADAGLSRALPRDGTNNSTGNDEPSND